MWETDNPQVFFQWLIQYLIVWTHLMTQSADRQIITLPTFIKFTLTTRLGRQSFIDHFLLKMYTGSHKGIEIQSRCLNYLLISYSSVNRMILHLFLHSINDWFHYCRSSNCICTLYSYIIFASGENKLQSPRIDAI